MTFRISWCQCGSSRHKRYRQGTGVYLLPFNAKHGNHQTLYVVYIL